MAIQKGLFSSVCAVVLTLCMLVGCGQTQESASQLPESTDPGVALAEQVSLDASVKDANASDANASIQPDASLPDYVYPGDDPYVSAICSWMLRNANAADTSEQVCIPSPIILYVDDSDPDQVIVYGNFWSFSYSLQQKTLLTANGGEMPGAAHLIHDPETGAYSVESFDAVGDGADYAEDIHRLFGSIDGLESQFWACHEDLESVRTEYIAGYVQANGLSITQYQDYGWQPVTLPGAQVDEQDNYMLYVSPLGYTLQYDCREFVMQAYGEDQEFYSGVDPLIGISLDVQRLSDFDLADIIQNVQGMYTEPQQTERAIGAGEVPATVIFDAAAPASVLKETYIIDLGDESYLTLSVRNTYFAVQGDPVVEGGREALEKLVSTLTVP